MRKIPIFPWSGSSWGKFIKIKHLCTETNGWIETHAGSASCYLRLDWQPHLAILNDLNKDVINLLNIIVLGKAELDDMLEYTLWSEETMKLANTVLDTPDSPPVHRAWALLVMLNLTRYYYGNSQHLRTQHLVNTSHGKSGTYPGKFANWSEQIKPHVPKLRKAFITNRTALHFIRKCDHPGNTLFIDPPFLRSKRVRKVTYPGETPESNRSMHIELLETVTAVKYAKVILLGYNSNLYRDYLGSWYTEEYKVNSDGSPKNESVWVKEGV